MSLHITRDYIDILYGSIKEGGREFDSIENFEYASLHGPTTELNKAKKD